MCQTSDKNQIHNSKAEEEEKGEAVWKNKNTIYFLTANSWNFFLPNFAAAPKWL